MANMTKEEFIKAIMRTQKIAKIRKEREKESLINSYKFETVARLTRRGVIDLSRK